jgi:hypothetical protein
MLYLGLNSFNSRLEQTTSSAPVFSKKLFILTIWMMSICHHV